MIAVVRRAAADAKGLRLGAEKNLTDNGYYKRHALAWFRERATNYLYGWGSIFDALGLQNSLVSRIEADVQIVGRTPDFDLFFGRY